ncbi:MAG TPA: flagellar type III secretion system pore protein FliP [Solimonas sp.]|nr:flagellar type III secretion system pore protein FliP [Solimonas sp.]
MNTPFAIVAREAAQPLAAASTMPGHRHPPRVAINMLRVMAVLAALLLVLLPELAAAAPGMPAVTATPAAGGGTQYSLSLQTLLLMTGLTLLPGLLLAMTAFTRIIIVLGLLRQALGTGQTPTNQVLVALALLLTFFVMSPVFDRIYTDAAQPYLDGKLEFQPAVQAGVKPLREFMLAQTREADLLTFARLSEQGPYEKPEDIPFSVLAAAFMTSELTTAFQIGFLLFIPFVIIDLVVSSVLMSMGMMMLSPMLISLPFKLMLFVLVDGWSLVMGTLAASFH